MRKIIIAAVAATVAISSAASAAVTFDPATGTGFVGKGDIQLGFVWNNAQLQASAAGLTFAYTSEEVYKYDCTFTVAVGRDKVREPRTQSRGKTTSIAAAVAFDARRSNQITGFNLNGLSNVTTTGEVPVEGGSCPGGQFADGVISDVTLMSESGGLTASSGGNTIAL